MLKVLKFNMKDFVDTLCIPSCFVSYCNVLYCIVQWCTALYCTVSYQTVQFPCYTAQSASSVALCVALGTRLLSQAQRGLIIRLQPDGSISGLIRGWWIHHWADTWLMDPSVGWYGADTGLSKWLHALLLSNTNVEWHIRGLCRAYFWATFFGGTKTSAYNKN